MDPAKVNADQNPMTKSNGHPVQGSFAQPTYAVPKIDKPRVIGRKCEFIFINPQAVFGLAKYSAF
jgi:hypothetical protein